jgi:hypothetical protein
MHGISANITWIELHSSTYSQISSKIRFGRHKIRYLLGSHNRRSTKLRIHNKTKIDENEKNSFGCIFWHHLMQHKLTEAQPSDTK